MLYTLLWLTIFLLSSMHFRVWAAITCDGLMSPYHGRVQWSSLSLNSVATYTCSVGFVLEGARERTCQENGQWSGVPPLCKCMCLVIQFTGAFRDDDPRYAPFLIMRY